MIVQCDQCQTRFKIPDEKVTEKGVKVRCTRCQHTFRVSRAPAVAAPVPTPPPAVDPNFDELDAPTRVGSLSPELLASLRTPDPGAAARKPPAAPAPAFDPFALDAPSPPAPAAAPFDPFALDAPPPAPAFDPFALDATSPAAPVYNPAASAAPEPTSAAAPSFDPFEDLPPPAPSAATQTDPFALPPKGAQASTPAFDPFAGESDPFATDDSRASTPAPLGGDSDGGFEPSDPFGGDSLSAAPSAAQEDPFGQMTGPEFGGEPDARALFDIPAPPAPRSPSSGSSAALALDLPEAPPPAPTKPAAVPLGALKLSAPPKDEAAEAAGNGRGVVAAILNLGVAAVLVAALFVALAAWVQGGRVDASTFTVENLRALFAPASSVVAVDVTNGLYLTREGREVFYVRGEAENRSEQPQRVRVQVEVLDGSQRVKVGSVLAGSSPSPEALHAVTTREQLDALKSELDKEAVTLAPGQRAPFLVPFFEYPPNLGSYQLRVTILPASGEAGGGGETATR